MNHVRVRARLVALAVAAILSGGCANPSVVTQETAPESVLETTGRPLEASVTSNDRVAVAASEKMFRLEDVPAYSGNPYEAVNGNVPYFARSELTETSFESYSDLDSLGRCGPAVASVGTDIMPTEKRGNIGQIKPSGWHTVKYDNVDGKYLYNRCHLIGYQLTGENDNEKNLITGTRYLNTEGMLPFENMVADYVKETGNHVLYRVTPVFEGDALVALGVLMEGWSVEDDGEGILFCVYVYNVQPGIAINYADGSSALAADVQEAAAAPSQAEAGTRPAQESSQAAQTDAAPVEDSTPRTADYILNTNTKKFHYPTCSSVGDMKESNKKYFTGTRDEAVSQGYVPCKRCNP